MADRISSELRSAIMARVRGKDTKPELAVRRAAHRLGFRFRLHRKDLPGRPDLVFPRRRVVVFVHGCFWHRHAGCPHATTPRSNVEFWEAKFARNVARDAAAARALELLGWRVRVLWECEVADRAALPGIVSAAVLGEEGGGAPDDA